MKTKNGFFREAIETNSRAESSDSDVVVSEQKNDFLNQCVEAFSDCFLEDTTLDVRRSMIETMYDALKPLTLSVDWDWTLSHIQDLIHMALDGDYIPEGKNKDMLDYYWKLEWLSGVLKFAIHHSMFSVIEFFISFLGINPFNMDCLDEVMRGSYVSARYGILKFFNCGGQELLALASDSDKDRLLNCALLFSIDTARTDFANNLIKQNPELVNFSHVLSSLNTRCPLHPIRAENIRNDKQYMTEKGKILNGLLDYFDLNQEELNQCLFISATQDKVALPIVCQLLERGADLNHACMNITFNTSRMKQYYHCKSPYVDVFRTIKRSSALLEACAIALGTGMAELFKYHGTSGQIELIKLLTKNNADPNLTLQDEGRHTVFHLVVMMGCISSEGTVFSRSKKVSNIFKILIDAGADPLIQNAQGQDCYDLVRKISQEKETDFRNLLEPQERASCVLL